MYSKISVICVLILIFSFSFCYAVSEGDIVSSFDKGNGIYGFSDIYQNVRSLNLNLNPKKLLTDCINVFVNEVRNILGTMKYIMLIVCINSFMTNFNSSFVSSGINNAVYLACYCLFVVFSAKAFSDAGQICISLIDKVITLLKVAVPVCISLITTSANITSQIALKPLYLYFLEFIACFLTKFILPVINAFFALSTVGCISARFSIRNLTDLLKKVIKWTMTGVVTLFIGSISVMGVVTDKVIFKGEKSVRFVLGNFVPIVGRLLSDTLETVAASAVLIKNSVGISGIIMIAVICIPPLIKLFAMVFSYKLCSALIEPICDRRLSSILSVLSSSVELMLGICVTAGVILSISVSVLLAIGG